MVRQLTYNELPKLRDKLLKQQNHICPICNKPVKSPVVDHHHTKRVKGTGKIRGVLCRSCNVLLGKVENNCTRYNISQRDLPQVLINMACYLQDKPHPYIHPCERPKKPVLKRSSYNRLKKKIDGRQKIPAYPRSGNLTKELEKLYKKYGLEPEFYSEP